MREDFSDVKGQGNITSMSRKDPFAERDISLLEVYQLTEVAKYLSNMSLIITA